MITIKVDIQTKNKICSFGEIKIDYLNLIQCKRLG